MKRILLLILLLTSLFYAQTKNDSLEHIGYGEKNSEFSTKLDKQLSTYTLINNFRLNKSINSFDVSLFENYNSTLIRSTEKNVKDEHFFTFKTLYNISPEFSVGVRVNNNILSDNRKIEINNASISDILMLSNVILMQGVSVTPFWGYTNNRQIGESNYGYVYGLESSSRISTAPDFIVSSDLNFKNEDINPRKNFQRYLNVDLKNLISERVYNVFSVLYSSNKKDFYYAADSVTAVSFKVKNNIQSRIENNYNIQDSLSYGGLFDIFQFDLSGGVSWREIDRDTRYQISTFASSSNYDYKITELKFDMAQSLSFNFGWFEGIFKGLYSDGDEKHTAKSLATTPEIFSEANDSKEAQKNNSSERVSFSFTGALSLSPTDRLLFSLFHNKLSYNTPDAENYDDRDELYSIVRLRYNKTFSPFFNFFINTEADFNHIVYIFSERSSNNNLNRVIKLSSGGTYSGKNFSSTNIFEVSANYTVYDFESLNSNLVSFSFRQFSMIDSSIVNLSKRLNFLFYANLKFSEQGDFKWDDFSTHPVQYIEETYLEPKFSSNFSDVSFALGLRYFSLYTYRFNKLEKVLYSKYQSVGPLTEIFFKSSRHLLLRVKGYYEIIKTDNNSNREIPNVNCEIIWNF